MPQTVYKIGLFILVLLLSLYSIELSFIASVFLLAISVSNKVSVNLISSSLFLIIITVIGVISSYGLKYQPFDTLKDIIYFIRPVTILFASYFAVKRLKSKTYVFNVVVTIALVFAIIHLFNIVINIGSIDSYVYLRTLGGKQNHIEIVALVFLFFTPYCTAFKKYHKLVVFIITISFLLYLSRTMFIVLFMFFVGYKGYLFLNRKLFRGILLLTIISVILGIVLSNIETNRNSTGFKAFVYKTQNSFSELFESIDTKTILRDRRGMWEHWRAYEAQKAIEQMNNNGTKAWLIGLGFGSKVDLETEVRLDGKQFSEVPSIHNGFVNVLFKTGTLGLLCYCLFIFYIFGTHQRFKTNDENILLNKLILATSVYMLFNSFVITGFYRPGEFSVFLYGIFVASKYNKQQQIVN
ncbi:O-antigen ligase family protein [Psychroserpens sp.]|uniref:O-antigen ligase family protein n=1 Tax=Psychroserpens sp. TaxID=2020870 RepID=UPI003859CA70